jgi:hypothetical protein
MMATKAGMTKQRVRDLNQYGPRRRKDALGDRLEDKPKASSSVGTGDKGVTR